MHFQFRLLPSAKLAGIIIDFSPFRRFSFPLWRLQVVKVCLLRYVCSAFIPIMVVAHVVVLLPYNCSRLAAALYLAVGSIIIFL